MARSTHARRYGRSPNTKFNINELVSPAGVLFAAVIAGLVAWWNARTSPHGRLQTLIGIYRQWPRDSTGSRRSRLDCGHLGKDSSQGRYPRATGSDAHRFRSPGGERNHSRKVPPDKGIILAGLLVVLLIVLAAPVSWPAQPAGSAASGIFVIFLAMTLPFIRK